MGYNPWGCKESGMTEQLSTALLLQRSRFSRVRLFATPWTVANSLLRPWDFPGKRAGVDCHFLLQGIFLTQESNLGLLHCSQILYHLSHQK